MRGNFVGLSHLAFNAKLLREQGWRFAFPDGLIALDWYMAVWFLLQGLHGVKTAGSVYYRIYAENTAGKESSMSKQRLEKVVDVKQRHYQALLNLPLTPELRKKAEHEMEYLGTVGDKLSRPETCKQVLDAVNRRVAEDTSNYWWVHI